MNLLCVLEANNQVSSYSDLFDDNSREKGLFYMTPVPDFFTPPDEQRSDREREDVDRVLSIAVKDIYNQLLEEKMQNGLSLKLFFNLAQEVLSDAGDWLTEEKLNDILKFAMMSAEINAIDFEESVRVLMRYHKKLVNGSSNQHRCVISPVSVFAACFSDSCMRELSSQPHSVDAVRRCVTTLGSFSDVNRSIIVLLKGIVAQDENISEEDVVENIYTFVKTYSHYFGIELKESETRLDSTIRTGLRILGGM